MKQAKNNQFKLSQATKEDYAFTYKLIKEFLTTDLSVTFLKLPKYSKFVKTYFENDYKRYILINSSNEKMGFVVLTKDNEIGYFLSSEYQGKGIATKAVKMLLKLHPRKRYFATVHNKNKHSINVATRLGFYAKGTIYEKTIK